MTKYLIGIIFGFLAATAVGFSELEPFVALFQADEHAIQRQAFIKRYDALDGDIESVYRTYVKKDTVALEEVLKLRLQLQIHEGRKAKVYKDSLGLLTVGVGHLVQVGDVVPPSSIEAILFEDMLDALQGAKRFCGQALWDSLSFTRQRVLIDLAFNVGSTKLAEFKKFKAALVSKDYKTAVAELRTSKWCSQTKTRCTALTYMLENDKDYYDF